MLRRVGHRPQALSQGIGSLTRRRRLRTRPLNSTEQHHHRHHHGDVLDLHQQHRIGAIWQTTASLHSSSSSSSSYHSRLDSTTCPPLRAANKFIVPWWELRGAGGQGHGMPLALLRQTAGYASQPLPQAKSGDGKEKDPSSSIENLDGGAGVPTPLPGVTPGAVAPGTSPFGRYVEEGFKPEDLKPEQGVEDPRKEENSPSTVGGIVRRYANKATALAIATPGAIVNFTVWLSKFLLNFIIETIKNPSSLTEKWIHIKKVTKEEFHHYALGSKVLWSDIKTSWSIIRRLLNGHTLSRRERRQLTRTTADLFRLVPFAFFVIVPFMELLLPVALKIFPNMLPSTFQDNLKTEENMKRELKVRLALAGFLKDTLSEITNKKVSDKESPNAQLLNEFVEKARAGTHISTSDINRFARLFKDELTLDNMSRPQLAGMCVYMGLRPYGTDNFLRFQLRAKLRNLKEDDGRIVWEGIDNMTKAELREACRERGMRAYGLTQLGYRRQLQQWLDLSINKEVPISLLILSRAFTLDSKFADPAAAVADSISSLDKDVVDEVILDVASGKELTSPDIRAKKLESIERQNELIEEERKRERERKKKADEAKKAQEEKKKAAEEEKKAAAAAAAVAAPASGEKATADAAQKMAETAKGVAAAETGAVKEAVAHAAQMTSTAPKDGAPQPTVSPAESLPKEKILTEAEIVSKALPSLTAEAAAAAAAAKPEEEKKTKKPELTVAEANALRSLIKESAVDREKTLLAQLKAELQTAATAKAAAAASESKIAPSAKGPVGTIPSAAATAAAAIATTAAATTEVRAPEAVPTTTTTTAAAPAAATPATPAPTTTKAEAVADEEDEHEAKATSKFDKSIEKMRMKVASMLDKLEVDMEKVETTIGDKLHMLDKDQDGVLTTAELSEVIFHVLKRHNSEEEAMKLAKTMDKDADGILTVQELMEWIEHREELLEELGEDKDEKDEKEDEKESNEKESTKTSTTSAAAASTTTIKTADGADKSSFSSSPSGESKP